MPAARSVSDDPTVETSWATQSSEKSRLRKTANMDGAGAVATVKRSSPAIPRGRPASLAVPRSDVDPFPQEQVSLHRESMGQVAPTVAAPAAEGSVGGDDPVAGD